MDAKTKAKVKADYVASYAAGRFNVDVRGVARWRSNGQVPPHEVLKAWHDSMDGHPCFDIAECEIARDRDHRAFVAAHKASQPPVPSAEEVNEARAAFGPGVVVEDIITGRRFRT